MRVHDIFTRWQATLGQSHFPSPRGIDTNLKTIQVNEDKEHQLDSLARVCLFLASTFRLSAWKLSWLWETSPRSSVIHVVKSPAKRSHHCLVPTLEAGRFTRWSLYFLLIWIHYNDQSLINGEAIFRSFRKPTDSYQQLRKLNNQGYSSLFDGIWSDDGHRLWLFANGSWGADYADHGSRYGGRLSVPRLPARFDGDHLIGLIEVVPF